MATLRKRPSARRRRRTKAEARLKPAAKRTLKAMLEQAPLDGIDLARDPDTGRDVDL